MRMACYYPKHIDTVEEEEVNQRRLIWYQNVGCQQRSHEQNVKEDLGNGMWKKQLAENGMWKQNIVFGLLNRQIDPY